MPDLLLSSSTTPQTKGSNNNSLQQPQNPIRNDSRSAIDVTDAKKSKSESFEKVLHSTVEKAKPKNEPAQTSPNRPMIEAVKDNVEQLAEDVKTLLPDSEIAAELEDWLNGQNFSAGESLALDADTLMTGSEIATDLEAWLDGQDFSSGSVVEILNGLQLPELTEKLNNLLDSLKARLEQLDELNNGVQTEEQTQLLAMMNQVTLMVNGLSDISGNKQITPALLGFTMQGENMAGGQWQKYEPVQGNQAQGINHQSTMQGMQSGMANDPTMLNESVVSETDQHFQMKMDQAMTESFKDVTELSEAVIDNLSEAKDKPAAKFGDLQLRAANEGIKNYSTTLTTPVTSQQWSDEVSQKIVWFSGRNIQAAEMHLNPAELGPIDVKVHVQNDVTSVTFNVHNSSVRELLESNVLRLREMIESNGVNLGDVDINSGNQDQSEQAGSDQKKSFFSGKDSSELDEDHLREEQLIQVKTSNLVDYFV